MTQEPTKIYEGMITADSTPIAFRSAEKIQASNVEFSARPDEAKTLQDMINQLMDHNRTLLRAIGEIELHMNLQAGEVITGKPFEGSMTIDRPPARDGGSNDA